LVSQFAGMTEIPFSYSDYEETREKLIAFINTNLTDKDKQFLLSFEEGEPDWQSTEYADFQNFPAIQWKLLNINKLKSTNPNKHKQEALACGMRDYNSGKLTWYCDQCTLTLP
jgi:hypothetical protein